MDDDFKLTPILNDQTTSTSLRLLQELRPLEFPKTDSVLPRLTTSPHLPGALFTNESKRDPNESKPDTPELRFDRASFLGGPAWLATPLGLVAAESTPWVRPPHYSRGAGAFVAGAGAWQGFRDARALLSSQSSYERGMYGIGLTADTGMVAGGLMLLSKTGPRWLGATLALGGAIGRGALEFKMALDLDESKKK